MTIDGNTIKQPSGLREFYEYIRNDNRSLNGKLQRNQFNKKKVAVLTWTNLKPTELQDLLDWIDDLASHAYSNTESRYGTWAFTGLPTIEDEGNYVRGATYMTDTFTVSIREV